MTRVVALCFLIFVCLAFVGTSPLLELSDPTLEESGTGDIIRQVAFLCLTSIVTIPLLFKGSLRLYEMFTPSILLVLTWCLISIAWSPVPDIALRRFVLTAVAILCMFGATVWLGHRALKLFAMALLALVLLSIVAGALIPGARHQAWVGQDPGLIGAWRGLFPHKNTAGPCSALLVILSVFMIVIERRKIWFLGVFAGLCLLYASGSKTALGLLVPALVVGLLFPYFLRYRNGRRIYIGFCLSVLWGVLLAGVAFQDQLAGLLVDPDAFTGRTQIWNVLMEAVADRPWIGFGFGSLFLVSTETPLLDYASGWVLLVVHGHNGYLDVLAATGIVGLVLTLFAFVVQPLYRLIVTEAFDPRWVGLLMSLAAYVLLHNMTETALLDRAQPLWLALLLVVAATRDMEREFAAVHLRSGAPPDRRLSQRASTRSCSL